MKLKILLVLGLQFLISCYPIKTNTIDMQSFWDENKVCKNPHKGWYFHYFDNGIKKYGDGLAADDYLKDFPGLDHIYLRLAWSYLEPEEGHFNWELIDKEIERWTAHGFGIAFRITCKETGKDQPFATPKWVMKAGAKGTKIYNDAGWYVWEPDYGDPVFLQKLENFHKAFAERYADRTWLEYVDVGSYGDWGEGHTASSSHVDWPEEVIKKHIDIYCKYYKSTLIVISDDFVGSREINDGSKQAIFNYIKEKGLTLRDDSISVPWFAEHFGFSTVRNPDFFPHFWDKHPIILELEHYGTTKQHNTWQEGKPLLAAVEQTRATFVGFHGYPREWLSENPGVAEQLANRVGYWYFLKSATIPVTARPDDHIPVTFTWLNRGVARAYNHFTFALMLIGQTNDYNIELICPESNNELWQPAEQFSETFSVSLPADIPVGEYQVAIGLFEQLGENKRYIELALSNDLKVNEHFYKITQLTIK